VFCFQRYFGGCPAVSVPGRLYPIKLTYLSGNKREGGNNRADEKPTVVGSNPGRGGGGGGSYRRGHRNKDTGERFERIDPHPYLVLLQVSVT